MDGKNELSEQQLEQVNVGNGEGSESPSCYMAGVPTPIPSETNH